jgi:signal transduction histidine kinase
MSKKESKSKYELTEPTSFVSHQLKTPLSAIKGYVEVLLSEGLGGLNLKQREYLKDILENTGQMLSLVEDILSVARIVSLLAKAKNCELSLETIKGLPQLFIDPVKIKQAISNILSNAILYNKRKGQVIISISKNKGEVILCCKDTGIGINKKEEKRLFTKFYRSPRVLVRATGGSGLGLFLAKAIIEASGGKIWFESELDKGSTFCFSLPVK